MRYPPRYPAWSGADTAYTALPMLRHDLRGAHESTVGLGGWIESGTEPGPKVPPSMVECMRCLARTPKLNWCGCEACGYVSWEVSRQEGEA